MLCQTFLELLIVPFEIDLVLTLLVPSHLSHLTIRFYLFEFALDFVLSIMEQHGLQTFTFLYWLLFLDGMIVWGTILRILSWITLMLLLKGWNCIFSCCFIFHRVERVCETTLHISKRISLSSYSDSGSISLWGIFVPTTSRYSAKIMLMPRAFTWHWASSITLMLSLEIFVLSLWHTFWSRKNAKTLVVHYVCTKFAEI